MATFRGIWGNPPASSIKNNLDKATKPFELSPERSRFLLTQNLSEHHSFALSKEQADAASPDVGYYNNNYYIYFAPGISLFALPFYELGKQFNLAQIFSYSVIMIFAIANLIFIYLIGQRVFKFPVWLSVLTCIIYGFSSVSLSYATTLYQHHTTVFFILSSFYGVWEYRKGKTWGWMWGIVIWINYGLAILIDYPNAVLMSPVMIYFFISAVNLKHDNKKLRLHFRPSIIFTSFFFIIISLLHGYYNYVNFGDWKTVSGSLVGLKTIQEQKLEKGNLQKNLKALQQKKAPIKFLKEENMVNSLYTLLIAPDKGVFIFSPIFILGFLGIISVLSKLDMEKSVLLSIVLVNLMFYGSWGDPWGGWAFGPRYLIPMMGVLVFFIGFWLKQLHYSLFPRIITFLLMLYSTAIAFLGALTTNAVPPLPEAIYLKTKYGFFFTIDFLKEGRSSSFIYNNFFSPYMDLTTYYGFLITLMMVFIYLLVIILPVFSSQKEP